MASSHRRADNQMRRRDERFAPQARYQHAPHPLMRRNWLALRVQYIMEHRLNPEATAMAGSGDVKGAFDGAHGNLRWVDHYLMASPESADEPEMRLIGGLYDVAVPLLALWRNVTGVDGAARASGTIAGKLSEVRGLLFRAGRALPVNGEGTTMEYHLIGTAEALDALINLLSHATGPAARSTAILRKEATGTHQTAQHRYALALRAPDTAVDAVRLRSEHEGRIQLTQHLHRGVVDMARGVEAWTR